MSSQRVSTRQRLVDAGLELFTSQGITATTTRQIAELADVNEVTLFRQFGNKHGLLLAVIEESEVFADLGKSLVQQAFQKSNICQALKDYVNSQLQALEQIPEFVRSVVGEAGQYPAANRQALGQSLTQGNQHVAQYLEAAIRQGQLQTRLPGKKIASLLNSMLLGYTVIEFTSDFHELWHGRDDFLESLVELFLHGAMYQSPEAEVTESAATTALVFNGGIKEAVDLPATLVHSILQRAKKLGLREYGLAYVLFGAGLSPKEIAELQRSHQICDPRQHLLQANQARQVPVNQRILGKRYGSYTRNPLTQWLKSRKDEQPALFLNDVGQPISAEEIRGRWQIWTEGLVTPEGQSPTVEQAQQTWCVEMLTKGISLEDLSILTSWDTGRLQPYARRAREKAALEQAIKLDQ